MKKIVVVSLLVLLFFIASCEPQEVPKKEPFCGDDVCQANEEENGCKADCGGLEGITKLQCEQSGGKWNECGSPCAGTDAEICIQVCSEQCECDSTGKFKCPNGFKCRLSGKANEIGVCIRE